MHAYGSAYIQSTDTCPACRGTGLFTEDRERPCPYCSGLGGPLMPPIFGVKVATFHSPETDEVTIGIDCREVRLTPARADAVAEEIHKKAHLARRSRDRKLSREAKAARERVYR